MLSFGGTKNGCWCAEAVVFMNPSAAEQFPYLRMRAGQLFSKSRFVAAQFEAYLADGQWLTTARHANAMATRLAEVLQNSNRVPPRDTTPAMISFTLCDDIRERLERGEEI